MKQNKNAMRENEPFKTTAIFKCIINLKSGTHMIIRLTIDKVARFVKMFREQQEHIFKNESYLFELSADECLLMSAVTGAKFINECTGQELLSL